MPDTEGDDRRFFWLALLYASLSQFGGERVGYWAGPVAFLFVYVPYIGLAIFRYLRALWQIRRFVRSVRTLDSPGRAQVLEQIDDPEAREHLREALAQHGEPLTHGLVRSFTFSPIDRRQCEILLWVSGAAAAIGGLALMRGVAPLHLWGAGSGLAASMTLLASYRRVQLARTIEISPFGLSEIGGRGEIRRLLFAQPLTLSNHPWRRRLELRTTGHPEFIALPYELVGLDEAVNLLMKYGGFNDESA